MPVEIRELVIQAQVRENADPENRTVVQAQTSNMMPASKDGQDDPDDEKTDQEWIDLIVDRCMARMKEWLIEKSMR